MEAIDCGLKPSENKKKETRKTTLECYSGGSKTSFIIYLGFGIAYTNPPIHHSYIMNTHSTYSQ